MGLPTILPRQLPLSEVFTPPPPAPPPAADRRTAFFKNVEAARRARGTAAQRAATIRIYGPPRLPQTGEDSRTGHAPQTPTLHSPRTGASGADAAVLRRNSVGRARHVGPRATTTLPLSPRTGAPPSSGVARGVAPAASAQQPPVVRVGVTPHSAASIEIRAVANTTAQLPSAGTVGMERASNSSASADASSSATGAHTGFRGREAVTQTPTQQQGVFQAQARARQQARARAQAQMRARPRVEQVQPRAPVRPRAEPLAQVQALR